MQSSKHISSQPSIHHRSLQLVQVFEPRKHDLFASLLDLPGQEDLIEDGVDLVEVEDEVELADVAEEGVEDLYEEVDGLEVGELVVVGVDAGAEEEAGIPAVDDLVVAELDKVGLVLLVAGRHEAVDFALELDLLVVAVGGVPLGETGLAPGGGGGGLANGFVLTSLSWKGNVLPVLDQDKGEHGESTAAGGGGR